MTRRSPAQFHGSPRRKYYAGRNLDRVQSIGDLRARAHRLMPRFVLEYLEAGAGEEASLAREREIWAQWRFIPKQLRDISSRDTKASLLGREARLPLAIAPTGLNGLFMRGADRALARAAARFGVPFIQSTMSTEPMEEIARIPNLRHWWQLYVFGDPKVWQSLVERAYEWGCEALVVTSNAELFGQREWDSRTRIGRSRPSPATILDAALHPRWLATTLSRGMPVFANVVDYLPGDRRGFFEGAFWIREQMWRDMGWDTIAQIRARWDRPLFVKGLLHPEDLRAARESGIDGVILGTHGGRQADWSVTALDVIGQAREILGPDKALYMSGGIRRGTDVMKALALGADAVLAGRAPLYGLCAHGEAGVHKALEIIEAELDNEMGQIGVSSLSALGPDSLVRTRDLPLTGEAHGGQ